MNNLKFFLTFLIFLFLIAKPAQIRAQERPTYPTISIQGNEYLNACEPTEKQNLTDILKKKNLPQKAYLLQIIDTLLCGAATHKNINEILLSTNPKIRNRAEGTGESESDIKFVQTDSKIVKALFAEGQAWRSNLIVFDNSVRLQYSENEACVKERIIKFIRGKWRIVEVGQACD